MPKHPTYIYLSHTYVLAIGAYHVYDVFLKSGTQTWQYMDKFQYMLLTKPFYSAQGIKGRFAVG